MFKGALCIGEGSGDHLDHLGPQRVQGSTQWGALGLFPPDWQQFPLDEQTFFPSSLSLFFWGGGGGGLEGGPLHVPPPILIIFFFCVKN